MHGEVFVTDDGTEADQDLGNYERFLDQNMARENVMTSGLVYQAIIQQERNLFYEGKDVQMMSDVPREIIRRIRMLAKKTKSEFVLIEVGGTAGDTENLVFLEAARVMKITNPKDVLFVLVSYLPILENTGEMKSKPTQHAVRALNSVGIQPDMMIARSMAPIDKPRKEKISMLCSVHVADIIAAPHVSVVYEVPHDFERNKLGRRILEKFGLKERRRDGLKWTKLVRSIRAAKTPVKIGIVGKYFTSGDFSLTDAYLSVVEAIKHAAWSRRMNPEIIWLDALQYEKDKSYLKELSMLDGVIVPGGFGARGVEGKIAAIRYVREHGIPFLGLCYGLQLAVVEFARNVARIKNAHTTEVNLRTPHPVIDTMPDQIAHILKKEIGGTMRLGSYACRLLKNTHAYALYGTEKIFERHRHRYEVNNNYLKRLQKEGLVVSGVNQKSGLVEAIELHRVKNGGASHPFFVATQFHPELTSRPLRPHPLFIGLVDAAKRKKK